MLEKIKAKLANEEKLNEAERLYLAMTSEPAAQEIARKYFRY